jgi:hypothetical protein
MKRTALVILVFATGLLVAPASQARVMLDDGGSGGGVVLHTDTLGGGGVTSAIPLRPDVLGGNGEPSLSAWFANELRKDRLNAQTTSVSGDGDSFAWGETAGALMIATMLLALATFTVTRRRHRLSF